MKLRSREGTMWPFGHRVFKNQWILLTKVRWISSFRRIFLLSFPWQELCQTANPQFSNDDECILWRPPFEFESQNSSATPPCNALHFDYQSQAKKKNETEGVGKWTPNSSQQRFPLGNYPGLPPGVNMEIR